HGGEERERHAEQGERDQTLDEGEAAVVPTVRRQGRSTRTSVARVMVTRLERAGVLSVSSIAPDARRFGNTSTGDPETWAEARGASLPSPNALRCNTSPDARSVTRNSMASVSNSTRTGARCRVARPTACRRSPATRRDALST